MIWCVEDDTSIRDIELYTLRSTGFAARGFEDGGAFLAALETERPELVILDVMLPGMDGVELLRRRWRTTRTGRRFGRPWPKVKAAGSATRKR